MHEVDSIEKVRLLKLYGCMKIYIRYKMPWLWKYLKYNRVCSISSSNRLKKYYEINVKK